MKIEPAGGSSILVHFPLPSSASTSEYIVQLALVLKANFPKYIIDIVPAWNTLLIHYRLLSIHYYDLSKQIKDVITHYSINSLIKTNKTHHLPVWYQGIDLDYIAEQCQLTPNEVIDLHYQTTYFVGAIGFAPGFAYLANLSEKLQLPRRKTPRIHVEKGSVAIAETQTAIYPAASPGGWHLIGLCPILLFDIYRVRPIPFQVGDLVEFYPINKQQYYSYL